MGERKESCFSAVIPVMGWNQWVKMVGALFDGPVLHGVGHTLATLGSRGVPSTWSYAGRGRFPWEALPHHPSLNTRLPNVSWDSLRSLAYLKRRKGAADFRSASAVHYCKPFCRFLSSGNWLMRPVLFVHQAHPDHIVSVAQGGQQRFIRSWDSSSTSSRPYRRGSC
jgi:hypothetical protein